MIIDGHAHIFTQKVIEAGCAQKELTALLQLEASQAPGRLTADVLKRESSAAGVTA